MLTVITSVKHNYDAGPGKYLTATEREGVLIQRVIMASPTNGTTTWGGGLSKGRQPNSQRANKATGELTVTLTATQNHDNRKLRVG